MNNREKKKFLWIKVVLLCFFFYLGESVYHLTALGSTGAPFSVRSLAEDGSVNEQGYYLFDGEPKEQVPISIQVMNNTNKPLKIHVEAVPAQTNKNGITTYLKQKTLDKTLEFPFDTLVEKVAETLVIEGGETQTYTTTIHYPEKEWGGEILGGFRFYQETEEANEEQVTHQFAYTVGVLLRQKNQELPLNELIATNARMGQRNYRNFIEVNLQNKQPVSIQSMQVSTKVYFQNENQPIIQYEQNNLRMAPNSNFDFGIETFAQPIRAGEYRVEMSVEADDQKYHFTEKFHVNSLAANELNQSAVDIESSTPWMFYVTVCLLVVLLLVILYWLAKTSKEVRAKKREAGFS
jgi:flagellin-like hook-associated protein FlgL